MSFIVGGYAVGYHGFVRATGDLDIFVRMSPSNAVSLVKVFGDIGFTTPELKESLFLEEGKIVRIGLPPIRIEVLTSISGIRFEDAYPKRIEEVIAGVRMPFIDLENLLKNKAASGRLKDLADVEGLRKKKA